MTLTLQELMLYISNVSRKLVRSIDMKHPCLGVVGWDEGIRSWSCWKDVKESQR